MRSEVGGEMRVHRNQIRNLVAGGNAPGSQGGEGTASSEGPTSV